MRQGVVIAHIVQKVGCKVHILWQRTARNSRLLRQRTFSTRHPTPPLSERQVKKNRDGGYHPEGQRVVGQAYEAIPVLERDESGLPAGAISHSLVHKLTVFEHWNLRFHDWGTGVRIVADIVGPPVRPIRAQWPGDILKPRCSYKVLVVGSLEVRRLTYRSKSNPGTSSGSRVTRSPSGIASQRPCQGLNSIQPAPERSMVEP